VLPVDIIGIGQLNGGTGPAMYAGKRLSWVRETESMNITQSWTAVQRDVVITGPFNGRIETFNLIDFSLIGATGPANRTLLKQKLIAAATPADTDQDKLPDFWETSTYGNLSRNGGSQDAGGHTALQRYAHCAATRADMQPRIVYLDDGSISIVFSRRRGTAFGLTVLPEFSRALSGWTGSVSGNDWTEWNVRTQYNGSCSELVEWKILTPGDWRNVRVRCTLP